MAQQNYEQLAEKMMQLYVMETTRYLVQYKSKAKAAYRQIKTYTKRHAAHSDVNADLLTKHMQGKTTVGVFNGEELNKFICFDVDYADNHAMARWVALKIVDVLMNEFNIPRDFIHVSLSGGKGYHVDLFVDEPIMLEVARMFHAAVLDKFDLPEGGDVEFRPSSGQGVKLPLGIHRGTGARCWYVDSETLEPLTDFGYLLTIEPMDSERITALDLKLTTEQAAEFGAVARGTNLEATEADLSKAFARVSAVIEAGQLIESNTRNHVTFDLARFYNHHGLEADAAVDEIMRILHNTPGDYFSRDSKPEHWEKEAERITRDVYEKGYTFGSNNRPVDIHKSEILSVLSCGTFQTKQMLYGMIVTRKRYGQNFIFPESVAMKTIGTTSKATVGAARKRLIEGGYIECTRKGEIDYARSKQTGQFRYKPNRYRLLLDEPKPTEAKVTLQKDQSIVEVAYLLCDVTEIKQYIKRFEFNNRWKTAEK